MRTRNLALLGLALVLAVLAAALIAPHISKGLGSAYVPASIHVAPAAAVAPREATPVSYQLPELAPAEVPCGTSTQVEVPESTDEVLFAGFTTSNGYIKVVATLTDTGRTFTWPPTEGWQVNPIAPYRAEWLTPILTIPCPEPEPTQPPTPEDPATAPPVVDEQPPAPESETPRGRNCRD